MLPSWHVSRLENYKLFCCFSLFHLSLTYNSSKKCIPSRLYHAVPHRPGDSPSSQSCKGKWGFSLSLHVYSLIKEAESRPLMCQASGSLPVVALGTCERESQTSSTTTSLHQLSSQTATPFQQKAAQLPTVAAALTLKALMCTAEGTDWQTCCGSSRNHCPEPFFMSLPKVSVSTERDDWKTGHQKDLLWM